MERRRTRWGNRGPGTGGNSGRKKRKRQGGPGGGDEVATLVVLFVSFFAVGLARWTGGIDGSLLFPKKVQILGRMLDVWLMQLFLYLFCGGERIFLLVFFVVQVADVAQTLRTVMECKSDLCKILLHQGKGKERVTSFQNAPTETACSQNGQEKRASRSIKGGRSEGLTGCHAQNVWRERGETQDARRKGEREKEEREGGGWTVPVVPAVSGAKRVGMG